MVGKAITKAAKRLAAKGPPTRGPVAEITVGETGQAVTRTKVKVAQVIRDTNYSSLAVAPKRDTIVKRVETWRRKGGLWMALEERYGMEVLLMLAPLTVELVPGSRTILRSEYEHLPVGERDAFLEILDDLRPRLRNHGPGLARLFKAIYNPYTIPKDELFRLETLSDEEILSQELDSDVLTSAFDMVPRSSGAVHSMTPSPNKTRRS
ncbi:MAG: hypothetical protein M1823_003806 [Watsoniomyces obsoletus]|nr:MAG: hypothetical protein M1823_003806 [Watsoniomyces obsoletus]